LDSNKICHKCGGIGLIDGGVCPKCGVSISYGIGKNKREIHVSGTDHNEVLEVAQELSKDNQKHPFLVLLANGSFWFGSLLALLGVVLVMLGSTGTTEFLLFSQLFKSQNIGIASFFLGAALVVLNVRRILKSFDRNH
jgi:hypothetical protein